MDLLEDKFHPYDQVPWDELINSLWIELVYHLVEEAWLAVDAGFMHPDEERLPLACRPAAMACPPPQDCAEATAYEEELPPASLPRTPA